MGRIQVVLPDDVESQFRDFLVRKGGFKKGDISEEINGLIKKSISEGYRKEFVLQESTYNLKDETQAVSLETPTNFLEVMGNHPINKILDFLIENKRESWVLTEICQNSGVSYAGVKLIIPNLLIKDLVKVTKKVGKISLYQINLDNTTVKRIIDLRKEINRIETEKYLK